jgi:hypothetical protein
VENSNCDEPFFISHFSETIKHYLVDFDTLDVTISNSFEEQRILLEKAILVERS